jgi:catechol 2,3-dioxygenase-like lactoylglutathione lyase family enzyme
VDNVVTSLVPMAFVASVPASVAFYSHLGFEVRNSFTPDGQTEPSWAYLTSGRAQLMVAKASEPVVPEQQAVLFYVYCEDVAALRDRLLGEGVKAGAIAHPFYAPRGEFRLRDPDGYAVMVTHT